MYKQIDVFTPKANLPYPLGYLITLVFKDPFEFDLFNELCCNYTDFLIDKFNFEVYETPINLTDVYKLEDDIEILRRKTIVDYPIQKKKTIIIVSDHMFSSYHVLKDKVDNVFSVSIKRVNNDLPQSTLNIEFEVIKFRGTQRNIAGTKFSVNIPSIL